MRTLEKHATQILKDWLLSEAHFNHPYPTNEERDLLAIQANISPRQVRNWFVNARKRIWRPLRRELEQKAANAGNVPITTTTTEIPQTAVPGNEQKRRKISHEYPTQRKQVYPSYIDQQPPPLNTNMVSFAYETAYADQNNSTIYADPNVENLGGVYPAMYINNAQQPIMPEAHPVDRYMYNHAMVTDYSPKGQRGVPSNYYSHHSPLAPADRLIQPTEIAGNQLQVTYVLSNQHDNVYYGNTPRNGDHFNSTLQCQFDNSQLLPAFKDYHEQETSNNNNTKHFLESATSTYPTAVSDNNAPFPYDFNAELLASSTMPQPLANDNSVMNQSPIAEHTSHPYYLPRCNTYSQSQPNVGNEFIPWSYAENVRPQVYTNFDSPSLAVDGSLHDSSAPPVTLLNQMLEGIDDESGLSSNNGINTTGNERLISTQKTSVTNPQ